MGLSKILNLLFQHLPIWFFEVPRLKHLNIVDNFIAFILKDVWRLDLGHARLGLESVQRNFRFVRPWPHIQVGLPYHPHNLLLQRMLIISPIIRCLPSLYWIWWHGWRSLMHKAPYHIQLSFHCSWSMRSRSVNFLYTVKKYGDGVSSFGHLYYKLVALIINI